MLLFVLQIVLRSHCTVAEADPSADLSFYSGIVKVPSFFHAEGCAKVPHAQVDVFSAPNRSKKIAMIRWERAGPQDIYCVPVVFEPKQTCPRGVVPVIEEGYEERAFVVLARSGQWARIRLDYANSGWIRLPTPRSFVSYDDLMLHRLTQFTSAWDGWIYETPEGKARTLDRGWREVDVVEARRVKGVLWFHLRVLTNSICEVKDPRVVTTGWVRGYGSDNRPTIRHFSRGC